MDKFGSPEMVMVPSRGGNFASIASWDVMALVVMLLVVEQDDVNARVAGGFSRCM